MFVCCACCVLSGRGLCDELITRPEESYRLWCVVVWSRNLKNEAMTRIGSQRHSKKKICFEHYPAHHQEVYVVTVYIQPLVSSMSAGDCPVHRLRKNCNVNKKVPLDATVCRHLFTAKSLNMFRVSQYPSSGALKTATATSGIGHNTGTATSFQVSSCTSVMIYTRGSGYSF